MVVLDDAERAELAALATAADERPRDVRARKASGLAHMRATLAGALDLQTRAELDLEAAFALDPHDPLVSRSLGRFYNLRAVAGDASKGSMQVEVYRAYLGDLAVPEMGVVQFVAWAFSRLGRVLELRARGRLLAALSEVGRLERALESRSEQRPDNLELHALAGNFALFFAGALPTGKPARVRRAVHHFEQVIAHWDDLRRGARHPELCPNTRENFTFELAEAHLALGNVTRARALYDELSRPRAPVNPARALVAEVSTERLAHVQDYAGDMRLMPPWPSDVGNCVICHAGTAAVPRSSLY
ncbi:MAG: hypothetical protein AB1Z98_36265, partial [Nannocystaceae bacterium]